MVTSIFAWAITMLYWARGWKLLLLIGLAGLGMYIVWRAVAAAATMVGDDYYYQRGEILKRRTIPGILLFLGSLAMILLPSAGPKSNADHDLPLLASVFAVNNTAYSAKITVGKQFERFEPQEKRQCSIYSDAATNTIALWLNDEKILEQRLEKGSHLASFSDDINVYARPIQYGYSPFHQQQELVILSALGLKRFDDDVKVIQGSEFYGFDEEVPEKIEVMQPLTGYQIWKIGTWSDTELLIEMLGQ